MCSCPFLQRPPLSAADDVVFVQVVRFLGVLVGHMPVQEALLLLFAIRDNLLHLLQGDSTRPRVRCALLDLMAALCTVPPPGQLAPATAPPGEGFRAGAAQGPGSGAGWYVQLELTLESEGFFVGGGLL